MHVDPLTITLIKVKYNGKSDKDFFKLKLCRDPTSSTSDLYGFKMSLFDNGKPEQFLLFVRNFNTNLVASRTLETGAKVQYRRMLVGGEAFLNLTHCLLTCKVRTF